MDASRERALLSHCTLCPRACGVDRTAGQRGRCGAGAELEAARAALHRWEEPCISGTRGAGAVFFSHCPLGCIYCQNAPISRGGAGKPVSSERLSEIFLELQAQGAHNLNLVTPMHYAPQIVRALERVRGALSIPVVVNCGGYERPETIRLFEGLADIWLPDYKYADAALAARYSAAPDYPETALAAIDEMLRLAGPAVLGEDGLMRRGVLIRHLLLPGALAQSMHAVRTLWERYGDDVILSLMSQYTPPPQLDARFPQLARRVSPRHYEALCDYAASLGITRCYVQEPCSAAEEYIPPFDGEGL